MIFIDNDFAISKTDTIFFDFDIAYVFHLAHAWLLLFCSISGIKVSNFGVFLTKLLQNKLGWTDSHLKACLVTRAYQSRASFTDTKRLPIKY